MLFFQRFIATLKTGQSFRQGPFCSVLTDSVAKLAVDFYNFAIAPKNQHFSKHIRYFSSYLSENKPNAHH
jgi:hypothetical protein